MKVSIGKAAKAAGVTVTTLREWDKAGKVVSERTPGGHRRYEIESVLSYANRNKNCDKITVIYVRISKAMDPAELGKQKQILQLYCASKGWKYRTIEDIGSGLNYNRQGLLELIKLIETNQLERIVLNYKDRLMRFGNELIKEICKYHNVEIVTITEDEEKCYEEELIEDALSIITMFSAKLYGSKSSKYRMVLEEAKKIFNPKDEKEIQSSKNIKKSQSCS